MFANFCLFLPIWTKRENAEHEERTTEQIGQQSSFPSGLSTFHTDYYHNHYCKGLNNRGGQKGGLRPITYIHGRNSRGAAHSPDKHMDHGCGLGRMINSMMFAGLWACCSRGIDSLHQGLSNEPLDVGVARYLPCFVTNAHLPPPLTGQLA